MDSQMISLDANSFVVKGMMGASGLRFTIPPPACAGKIQERKGTLETTKSVTKADRMPLVPRGRSSGRETEA